MNKVYAALVVVLTLAAAAVVVVPLQLIQAFKPQSAGDVALSYQLQRWGPLVTLVALLAGTALVVLLWRRRASWWLWVPMVVLVLAIAGFTWVTRINLYEQIFAPLEDAGFAALAEAEHVVDEEMVLGIKIGEEAKAYPVGILAYHHIVNDELGGVPLVVTY